MDLKLESFSIYNSQHKEFEKIIMKHWNILKKDHVLGAALPSQPRFIYRRATTLRDVIAPSVVDPPLFLPVSMHVADAHPVNSVHITSREGRIL